MENPLDLIVPIVLIIVFTFAPLGLYYLIGKHFEKKHLASIREREAKFIQMSLVPSDLIANNKKVEAVSLVSGTVVLGSDPFKRYVANLVNLVGGRVSVFETLLDRARREAILRMKEKAAAIRADEIVNFRMETMSICSGADAKPMGIVEMVAYGTAVRYQKTSDR
ncbi:MAG: heavy metal-binding domain-containing protein [Candidatus Rifleibacteriota bacterium]